MSKTNGCFACTQKSVEELGYTQWERLVGNDSEEAIENMTPCDCTRTALAWIDSHQMHGIYAIEVKKMKAKLAAIDPVLSMSDVEHATIMLPILQRRQSPEMSRAMKLFSRFGKGVNSPDPDQKARFQRLLDFISEHFEGRGLVFLLPILDCLEEPAKAPGRPSTGKRPNMKNREILAQMKPLIAKGETVAAAARQFANGDISKQKVLERGWRWKAQRRTAEG